MMKADDKIPELSLLGGPLHWLGSRLGLVRGGTDTIRLGVALGLLGWGVLTLLALLQGLGHKVFSLAAIGVHARLLVAIPLFFVCETKVAPRMAEFVGNIVRSEVVPPRALPMLESGIAGITRWKDSWFPEAMCLLATVLLPLIGKQLHLVGAMATFDSSRLATEWTLAGRWYWFVCLPLFRFLLFRWLWRLGLWCCFLWRVAKLELDLVPTHPDGAAGLGYLEVVQTYFTPLVLAISVVESASFAEGLSAGTMTFEAVFPALALILVLDAVLFLGPLLIFAPKLWTCRVKGLSDYMAFAARYVIGFDRKWLGDDPAPLNLLLGTQDLQSLADLSNSIDNVRNMRWVPSSLRLLESLAISALLPLVPLLLFKYPVADLARNFFTRLTGL
ncbi:MAG TPA: hypothetical protein VLB08_04960 [Candidatus Deferrimicrobium sp.]|nr:hypothetical protein [Candidatus Deferrimicrobium sp.]